MSKDAGIIGVETVEEHEDGGATFKFHMDAHARGLLTEEGLKLVMYCAAAKLDMGVVSVSYTHLTLPTKRIV